MRKRNLLDECIFGWARGLIIGAPIGLFVIALKAMYHKIPQSDVDEYIFIMAALLIQIWASAFIIWAHAKWTA